jgi:tRNA pseudouridine38-40 synthase
LGRVRLVVEYDGTGFCGFQKQPGLPTVQASLEARLSVVCGGPVSVVAAGRTDAGVHSLGQVVHFDKIGRIPVDRLQPAVNSLPGSELTVRHVEETSPEFHARFSAIRRTYHYHMAREQPSPFLAPYVLHEPALHPDAAERMRDALPVLQGTQDFAAFCGAAGKGTTVRTVFRAVLTEREPLMRLELTADAFLHNMVRIVAGQLLEIGCGRRPPETLAWALQTRDRRAAGMTAPPHGLFLVRVEYPDGYPAGAGENPGRGGTEDLGLLGEDAWTAFGAGERVR